MVVIAGRRHCKRRAEVVVNRFIDPWEFEIVLHQYAAGFMQAFGQTRMPVWCDVGGS